MDEPGSGRETLIPPPRVLKLEFSGSAREYFRIWIVNLFFSLVTLGIYSAWAKVRKKRYFYGSSRLDGDSFDYLANPKAILKGRLIAVAAFVIYAFAGELYPPSRIVFWILALLLLPWLVTRALMFNARNSVYRGLRFDFTASTRETAWFYIPRLLAVAFSAGLAYPWFVARQRAFTLANHAYGRSRFECTLSAAKFYGIYFRAFLITLATFVLFGLGMFALARLGAALPGLRSGWLGFVLPVVMLYAGYAIAYAYLQARTANLMWLNASGAGMRFESSLEALDLLRLYLGNIVAAALSVGLLIPWAVVRTLKYRLDRLSLVIEEEVVHEASPALAGLDATGQELGDIFNVDFGL